MLYFAHGDESIATESVSSGFSLPYILLAGVLIALVTVLFLRRKSKAQTSDEEQSE